MHTEDDTFLVRARQIERSIAEPEAFGLAMMELVAKSSVPISGKTSEAANQLLAKHVQPFLDTEPLAVVPTAVPEVEIG
jgi:hypothetical protein